MYLFLAISLLIIIIIINVLVIRRIIRHSYYLTMRQGSLVKYCVHKCQGLIPTQEYIDILEEFNKKLK